ncbi:hypothetical protein KAU09_05590 [Candidatus Parcubacteria bacterium]|nr:hypothetical protein [Candidatus Parcubacteria bacterium]
MTVDKKVCLKILDRALRVYPRPVDFKGQAKNFQKFADPDFQKFAEEHGILPKTDIEVWETRPDTFSIFKA